MTTFEIEDTNGNTLGHFVLKGNFKAKDLGIMKDCCLADIDDDYLEKEENLFRIQLE